MINNREYFEKIVLRDLLTGNYVKKNMYNKKEINLILKIKKIKNTEIKI